MTSGASAAVGWAMRIGVGIVVLLGVSDARAACPSAVTPGTWSGTVALELTGQGESPSSDRLHRFVNQIQETVDGKLDLRVACDGSVTGTLSGLKLRFEMDVVGTNFKSGKEARVSQTVCTSTSSVQVARGKVTAGPVLTLEGMVAQESSTCAGTLAASIERAGRSQVGFQAVYTLRASSSSPTSLSGTSWESDDPRPGLALEQLRRLGVAPTKSMRWSLRLVSAASGPPPPPRPTPDAPVIKSIQAKYVENFLQGVGRVPNQFTAEVDWKDGTPGTVNFRIGAESVDLRSPYTYEKDMAVMPRTAVLTAIATNGEGESSAPRTFDINIVPVPPWASKIDWAVELQSGFVLYRATKKFPDQPLEFTLKVPTIIPYIGGRWGLDPTQLEAEIVADSRGSPASGKVTGGGKFWVADDAYALVGGGDTSTQLGSTELQFLRGTAGIDFKPPYETEVVTDLLKYTGVTEALGIFARSARKLVTARAQFRATLQGQGTLGITGGKLGFLTGGATVVPQVNLGVVLDSQIGATLDLKGVTRGQITFSFVPRVEVSTCFLQFTLMGDYRFFSFTQGAWLYLDVGGPFVCRVKLEEQVGSSSAQVRTPLGVPPRPEGWQPPAPVDEPFVTAGGLAGRTLVARAGRDAAPALAASPSGARALAYVTEDPAQPRPRASEIAVRVFDGKRWGAPVAVTSDTRPDFAPQVAFDSKDQVVVGWVENRLDDLGPDAKPDERFLANLQVAAAVAGQRPAVLGAGRELRLVRADGGTVWALWRDGARIQAAKWTGAGFGKPEVVADQAESGWSAAARGGGVAVWAGSTAYERGAGGWSARPAPGEPARPAVWGDGTGLWRSRPAGGAPLRLLDHDVTDVSAAGGAVAFRRDDKLQVLEVP
jgi:hypothetical protein